MATQPDKTPKEPLQPGITQPQPTHLPDPMKQGEIPAGTPDPLTPAQN